MITIIIIAITSLVSILCFNGRLNGSKLLFNAYQVWHRKEWYRMFTSGMIHSGWGHLFFNMLTLYFFGRVVEQYFGAVFGSVPGGILYIVLYVSALAVSLCLTDYSPVNTAVFCKSEGRIMLLM